MSAEFVDEPLALFPLSTVLFPGGIMPLRIFETRYIDMVRGCLKSGALFGIVLIRSGSETGPAEVFDIGTAARIVDWDVDGDGLLRITVLGENRFVVSESYRDGAGLYHGFIREIPAEPTSTVPPEFHAVSDQADALLSDLEIPAGATDDAVWLSYRLAERLPVDREFKQSLLECATAGERLSRMIGLLESGVVDGRARR